MTQFQTTVAILNLDYSPHGDPHVVISVPRGKEEPLLVGAWYPATGLQLPTQVPLVDKRALSEACARAFVAGSP